MINQALKITAILVVVVIVSASMGLAELASWENPGLAPVKNIKVAGAGQCVSMSEGMNATIPGDAHVVYGTVLMPNYTNTGEYDAFIVIGSEHMIKIEVYATSYITVFYPWIMYGNGWYVNIYYDGNWLFTNGFIEEETPRLNMTFEIWSNELRVGFYATNGTPIWIYRTNKSMDPAGGFIHVYSDKNIFNEASLTACFTQSPVELPAIAPSAEFRLEYPFTVSVNQTVVLNATGTSVVGGLIDEFYWDFNGDGVVDRVTETPWTYTNYTRPGDYTIILTLKLMYGFTISHGYRIHVNPYSVMIYTYNGSSELMNLPGNETLFEEVSSLLAQHDGGICLVDLVGSMISIDKAFDFSSGNVSIADGTLIFNGKQASFTASNGAVVTLSDNTAVIIEQGSGPVLRAETGGSYIVYASIMVNETNQSVSIFGLHDSARAIIPNTTIKAGSGSRVLVDNGDGSIIASILFFEPIYDSDPSLYMYGILFTNAMNLTADTGGNGSIVLEDVGYAPQLDFMGRVRTTLIPGNLTIRINASARELAVKGVPGIRIGGGSITDYLISIDVLINGSMQLKIPKYRYANNPIVKIEQDGTGGGSLDNRTNWILAGIHSDGGLSHFIIHIDYRLGGVGGGQPFVPPANTTSIPLIVNNTATPPSTTSAAGRSSTTTSMPPAPASQYSTAKTTPKGGVGFGSPTVLIAAIVLVAVAALVAYVLIKK